jgi:predicted lipid-binding transport protein (Tim44 family)
MSGFEKAIAAREAKGVTEAVEFVQPPRSDFEGAEVKDDVARTRVRFLAEFRSRIQGPDGETAQDRRTAEVWTFERDVKSKNPNWTLIHVDAAEA